MPLQFPVGGAIIVDLLSTIMVAPLARAKIHWSNVDNPELVFQPFPSRRSVVYGTKGVVSSPQPLATEAGLEILRQGGNAGMHTHCSQPPQSRARHADPKLARNNQHSGRSCRYLGGAKRD